MAQSEVPPGISALVGLSLLVGLAAVAGLSVLAAERLEMVAIHAPVPVSVAVAAGAAALLVVLVRRWLGRRRTSRLEPTQRVDPRRHRPGADARRTVDSGSVVDSGTAVDPGTAASTGGPDAVTGPDPDRAPADRSRPDLTRAEAREILGVGLTADEAEIRRRYREQVPEHHPDRGGDEEAFKRLNAAYDRLLDERYEY